MKLGGLARQGVACAAGKRECLRNWGSPHPAASCVTCGALAKRHNLITTTLALLQAGPTPPPGGRPPPPLLACAGRWLRRGSSSAARRAAVP